MRKAHITNIVSVDQTPKAALLLLAALLVAGCGGKNDGGQKPAALDQGGGTPRGPLVPPTGHLYHGVYPGGTTGAEDDITPASVAAYEQSAGKTAAWIYFSHNWYQGREFPRATVNWIRERGSVPYIRLMLRSTDQEEVAESTYTLARILTGDFDADLGAWAEGARSNGDPLIVEWGTECNGQWFPWNGVWNGGGTTAGYGDPSVPDGPERFRDAFRHIVQVARSRGANNLVWVFHANTDDVPAETWNRLENYYPGDQWVDWIAVSVYGAQTPMDDEWPNFTDSMAAVYPRLAALSADKPIVLAEFGVTSGNPRGDQAQWAEDALASITSLRWTRLIGFSWWNEKWQNDDEAAHDANMRIQDNPGLAGMFQNYVGRNANVLGRVGLQ